MYQFGTELIIGMLLSALQSSLLFHLKLHDIITKSLLFIYLLPS